MTESSIESYSISLIFTNNFGEFSGYFHYRDLPIIIPTRFPHESWFKHLISDEDLYQIKINSYICDSMKYFI